MLEGTKLTIDLDGSDEAALNAARAYARRIRPHNAKDADAIMAVVNKSEDRLLQQRAGGHDDMSRTPRHLQAPQGVVGPGSFTPIPPPRRAADRPEAVQAAPKPAERVESHDKPAPAPIDPPTRRDREAEG